MDDLPEEVVLHILKLVSWRDVCSMGQVSPRFRDFVNTSLLWQHHYYNRFPSTPNETLAPECDWKAEFMIRHKLTKNVSRILSTLSSALYRKEYAGPLDFLPVEELCESYENADLHVEAELKRILKTPSSEEQRLTEKYYARLACSHVVHRRLVYSFCPMLRKIEDFREVNEDYIVSNVDLDSINTREAREIYLETGAIYIAQWFRPEDETAEEASVMKALDDLADSVRQSLPSTHSKRDILRAVSHTLFSEDSGMTGDEQDYYNVLNSFINCVIQRKKGIPITLSIVYQAVARRLGVHVEPVNFPGHFLLRWVRFPELNGSDKYEYIDAFKGGRLMTEAQCHYIASDSPFSLKEATYLEVWLRMLANLDRIASIPFSVGGDFQFMASVSELCNVLNPSARTADRVISLYSDMDIKMSRNPRLTKLLESLFRRFPPSESGSIPNSKNEINKRADEHNREVKFGVGMVMGHLKYNYECVIYGWDSECVMPQHWVRQMRVHQLPLGPKQPFYNVLVADGSKRYAAQENLVPLQTPRPIPHKDVGKYFEQFNGRYYVPNEMNSSEYPDDTNAFRDSFYPNS